MILASQKQIQEYTQKGWWRKEETSLDTLRDIVAKYPERMALIDPPNKESLMGLKPERVTYKEFGRAVDAVATALIEMGIEKDDSIILQMPNCWEQAMLHFAIARAGAILSSCPMQWRQRELGYIMGLTQAKAYLTVEEFHGFSYTEMGEKMQSELTDLKHVISLKKLKEMAGRKPDSERLDEIKVDPNDIFYIQWTSGTEAEPKGCPMSHNQVYSLIKITRDVYQYKNGDIMLFPAPLTNMMGEHTFMTGVLGCAGTMVIHHPFEPEIYIQQLIQERVRDTFMPTAMMLMLLKHPKRDQFDLSHLENVGTGGSRVPAYIFEEFKKIWSIQVVNTWGQNEGTAIVAGSLTTPVEQRENFPQFGKKGVKWPVQMTDAYESRLVDPISGKEVTKVGEVGEFLLKSPSVIPCYFGRPDMTQAAFEPDGFIHTGDLFRVEENDHISFFDRAKDIIIRGGFNISAQEIENILIEHPKVMDVAAVGMPDEIMGEKTCVYVVPKENETVTLQEITSFMREQGIGIYKLPERLEIIDAIPRNPIGKITKRQLREDLRVRMEKEAKSS